MSMEFADQNLDVESAFGTLRVIVTAEALYALWRGGTGPQDEADLIAEHRDLLEWTAAMKVELDDVEPDGSIRIVRRDMEI
ncbi:hypothetical protein [Sphingomonas colocasiae]|uniref:DUF1488 family protein n=1 Tax=Sphingomonas colocasiae TaxID=1848973 RepID=A0ABS7PIW5_9SPHN|nr:hypothetical protein [Sphingomonas colocasiae]MBY8821246.1 hypothetical protein [Sphingomonas colocasiae]